MQCINRQIHTVEESLINQTLFFFGSTGTKVLITSGSPASSATKTEVVDVVNGESCADLADFPLENCGAVGANLHGTPVVCGGYSSACTASPESPEAVAWHAITSIDSTVSLLSKIIIEV